jgi:hypothetical protein
MKHNDTTCAHQVRELLDYNALTGEFRWLSPRRPGDKPFCKAGTVDAQGYGVIKLNGIHYKAHRLAWLVVTGAWPQGQIDHIDGNRRNNAFSNLRDVDAATNAQNTRRARRDNKSSRFLGVSWDKQYKRWSASISKHGRQVRLGRFTSEDEAAQAYIAAKRLLHPGCTL